MKHTPFTTISIFLLTLLFVTGLSLPGYSQSPKNNRDNIVWLTNGDSLSSHQLKMRAFGTTETYLLLDQDRQIPLNAVSRFRSRHGTFIALPGSAGTDIYKTVLEGPRISTYERTLYEAPLDTNGVRPVAYYFRKPGQPLMNLVTYQSLHNAMADNPAAASQLQQTRTQLFAGLGVSLVSVLIGAIGLHETYKKNANQPLTQPVPPPSGQPFPPPPLGQPQLPPPSLPKTSVSPLVYVGIGGMLLGITVSLGARRHEKKAFDIYNR